MLRPSVKGQATYSTYLGNLLVIWELVAEEVSIGPALC